MAPPTSPPSPPAPVPPGPTEISPGGGSGGGTTWGARLREARRSRAWRIVRWPVLAMAVLLALGIAAFALLYATVDLPDELPPVESAIIYDAHGEELATFQQDGLRVEVALGDIAPVVVDAVIAAEDRRFYDHGGIDPIGLARAVANNLRGGDTQGGSTLTQQLVKNSYLTDERTMTRKVREAVLAFKLERRDDKDAILERYLNTVYFGRGAYGIEAAARVYFDTSAAELDTAQAALLVGLLRAPETADPFTDPDEAERRREVVLTAMVETGSLDQPEADRAAATDLDAAPVDRPTTLVAGVAPHFVEWVRAEAIAMFGEEVVYSGGLRITTTLDLEDQRAAEAAVALTLTEPDDPQAAVVGLDRSGAVRAYVGGRDFGSLQVDLARGAQGGGSGRQPGSTFKIFVLAAALEEGIPLGTVYPAPARITLDALGEPWEVANYGDQEFGEVDLTTATTQSINTAFAQLVLDVGPDRVADLARRAGVTADVPGHPSIALGTSELSPLDLATSYLTFARDGERVDPHGIVRVDTTSGEVLYEHAEADPERVVEEGPARAVNHALQTVLTQGTGRSARLDRPAAGKTGTTQGHGDAWFAGYTPEYAAVVWMGHPEGPDRAMTDVRGGSVTGGGLPAQIWHEFMVGALADVEPTGFEPPPDELLDGEERPESELVIVAEEPPDHESTDEGTDESTTTTTTRPTTSTSTSTSTTSSSTTTSSTTSTSTTSTSTTTSSTTTTTTTTEPDGESAAATSRGS